ncbi:hypothetical protein DL96DRAFT_1702090 [Flagelloscypha sp. PMI_526]|nr:hypothetical protein DL96DRAFT_1702090 [Flagelloscypha sp. PMI_526]
MGGVFDLYCMLSGASSDGGPSYFLGDSGEEEIGLQEIDKLASGLVEKIEANQQTHPNSLPPGDELKDILVDVLTRLYKDDNRHHLLPATYNSWCREVVLFGYPGCGDDDDDEITTFEKVIVCSGYDGYGGWRTYLRMTELGVNGLSKLSKKMTRRIVLLWTADVGVTCNLGSTSHPRPMLQIPNMSLELEFWEYGFISSTFGEQTQSCVVLSVEETLELACLKNAPYLTAAISKGVRGVDLVPAVLHELQGWIYETPDIWPSASEALETPTFMAFPSPSDHPFLSLPLDLMREVFSNLSISDLLNTSSCSKSFRQLASREDLFLVIIRDMVRQGSLRWVRPCRLVTKEVKKARKALNTWAAKKGGSAMDQLLGSSFPLLAFLRTCFAQSGSMKNRHRLWTIAKQFETKWAAFRRGEADI